MPHRELEHRRPPINTTLLGTALAVAPAAIGCAVGILVADRVKKAQRGSVASALFSIGALATAPLLIDYINKTLKSPAHRLGSSRVLRGIRNSGVTSEADLLGGDDPYLDQLSRTN